MASSGFVDSKGRPSRPRKPFNGRFAVQNFAGIAKACERSAERVAQAAVGVKRVGPVAATVWAQTIGIDTNDVGSD